MKNQIWLISMLFLSAGTAAAQGGKRQNLGIFLGEKKSECMNSSLKAYDLKESQSVLSADDIKLRKSQKPFTLSVEIPEKAVQRINKHLDGSSDHHLLFMKKGEIVFSPQVKEKLLSGTFDWTFQNKKSYEKALQRFGLTP